MTTFSAVVTTGIYCRPGCGAKPLAENVKTFELAAEAEAAGFRACLRCRPYRVAGPVGAEAPELVCRAVQLIIAGALDTGTEAALGERLAVSPRHLRRLFHDHLGVTPDQLARSRRAHFARRLLDDSDLTVADVAFASGFGSLRQFNRDMKLVFRASPVELRNRRRRADRLAADGGLAMRLPFAPPLHWEALSTFLGERAVPGVESVLDGVYRRTISIDGEAGVVEVRRGGDDHLLLIAHMPFWEGIIHVVDRVGRMFGVDADTAPAEAALRDDPVLAPLLRASRPPCPRGLGVLRDRGGGGAEPAQRPAAGPAAAGRAGRGGRHRGPRPGGRADPPLPLGRDARARGPGGRAARGHRQDGARVRRRGRRRRDPAGRRHEPGRLHRRADGRAGVGECAAQQIALRLGYADAFPAADRTLCTTLLANDILDDSEGLAKAWHPWRAFAATHLIAAGVPTLAA